MIYTTIKVLVRTEYSMCMRSNDVGRLSPVVPVPLGRAKTLVWRQNAPLQTPSVGRNECWLIVVIALPFGFDIVARDNYLIHRRRRLGRSAFPPQCVGGNYCSPAAGRRGIWLTIARDARTPRDASLPARRERSAKGWFLTRKTRYFRTGCRRERLWRQGGQRRGENTAASRFVWRFYFTVRTKASRGRLWETPEEHCVCRPSFNFEENKTFRKDPWKWDP